MFLASSPNTDLIATLIPDIAAIQIALSDAFAARRDELQKLVTALNEGTEAVKTVEEANAIKEAAQKFAAKAQADAASKKAKLDAREADLEAQRIAVNIGQSDLAAAQATLEAAKTDFAKKSALESQELVRLRGIIDVDGAALADASTQLKAEKAEFNAKLAALRV